MMAYPSMKIALEIFDAGIKKMQAEQPHYAFYFGKLYQSHCCLVACCAEIIASRIENIDGQKAYILGLLHDYGKIVRDADNKEYFHGLSGYNAMKEMGYDDVAKICLTHTFPNKDFKLIEYNYPEMRKTKNQLSKVEYDDYDRLIQLCDLLVLGHGFSKIKDRMRYVKEKYKVSTLVIKKKYREAIMLKSYFDCHCECDIYSLLGINQ